jgi:uncharacterized pyridoxal phosphate-containing UPF0001 family protein
VNVAGELAKGGCSPSELPALVQAIRTMRRLEARGLMTIPPLDGDAEQTRPYFAALRQLAEKHGEGMAELSMGMSGDYEVAIEEGATLVRVGTAIFGPRPK